MPRPSLLPSYYCYQAASTFVCWSSVFFVYYEQRAGLAVGSILALQAYNTALRALLDLPFGALADRHSRRGCLAASALAIAVGAAGLVVAPGLASACLAETLFAVAAALRSGADSALLFDALGADDRGALYPRAESRGQAVASLGSGAAAVAGGFLAAVDLRLPYLATALAAGASAVLAWSLPERRAARPARVAAVRLVREAARHAAWTPAVRWTLALAAFAVTASHVYFYLQQPYLRAAGVPLAAFGVVFAATKVVTAAVATAAHRLDAAFDRRRATALMAGIPVLGLGGMAALAGPAGALLILTRGLLDGLWMPLTNVWMNRLVESRLRATLLSVQSLLARLSLAAALAVLGVMMDRLGLRATLLGVTAAVAVAGALLVATAPGRWPGARAIR